MVGRSFRGVDRRIHLAGQDDEHKGNGNHTRGLGFVEGQAIYAHVEILESALFATVNTGTDK